ncbi:MAG: hypothetical protein AB8B59_16285 [Maribacter sp.]
MTFKYLLFFSLLICGIVTIRSQEKVLEFSADYPDTAMMQNSFTLVNSEDDSFTVFLSRKADVEAYNFNKEMEIQGRMVSTLLPAKFNIPLGGRVDDKAYTLFFSNKNKTKFAGVNFDFNTEISSTFDIDIKLTNEKFLAHFNYKNQFYLVTVSYREDFLNLYIFESSGSYEKKIIDLSNHEVFRTASYAVPVDQAFSADMTTRPIYKMHWVQKDVPYSLDSMTSLYKLYLTGDSIQFISDIHPNFTQVITYGLINSDVQVRQFDQPFFEREDTMSNSFLSDGLLYQFRINQKQMALNISDFKTQKILKEHRITKKEDLYLSSGPIRQRGGRYKKYRELEKTAQFLRKVGNGYPSIYVDKTNGTQKIVLGSVDEIDNSAIQALAFVNPFTAVASIGAVTLFFNPVALAMLRASDTKAVYITGYLDQNFQTTQVTEKDDIFYRVTDYLKQEKTKRYTAADIFQYKDYFLFGMLDKKTKQYSLRKFEK